MQEISCRERNKSGYAVFGEDGALLYPLNSQSAADQTQEVQSSTDAAGAVNDVHVAGREVEDALS